MLRELREIAEAIDLVLARDLDDTATLFDRPHANGGKDGVATLSGSPSPCRRLRACILAFSVCHAHTANVAIWPTTPYLGFCGVVYCVSKDMMGAATGS